MTFKVLDLFSGIGGFSLGLERTGGFKTIAFCEIDNYCQRVLHKHWPEVYIHSDIRTLTGKHFDGWERPDVIAGGFPCQDISNAGARRGLAGERSGLWFEYLRLIRELRPAIVIVENVAALTQRGLSRVCGDLAESGYDADWDCIPAIAVGAPHLRDRVFIVAYPNGVGCAHGEAEGQPAETRLQTFGDISAGGVNRELRRPPRGLPNLPNSDIARLPIRDETRDSGSPGPRIFAGSESFRVYAENAKEQWRVEPELGRVAHGIPNRIHRIRALGNSIVPQIATWIGQRILEASDFPPEAKNF